MNKIPLLIEMIGEEGVGKTHACLDMSNPILLDCTEHGEGRIIAMKRFPNELDKRYMRVATFNDLLAIPDGFSTYIFDTSKDLVRLMCDKWCRKFKKERVYPPAVYGDVYNMADKLIRELMNRPANVILTSIFRDEYIDDKRTGRRERDGYTRLRFTTSLRFHVFIKDNKRIFKVVKNRFIDKISDKYVHEINDFSFNKIIEITFDKNNLSKELVVM